MKDGTIATPEVKQQIADKLNGNVRPFTDNVIIQDPQLVIYNINLTYYIKSSDTDSIGTQAKVNKAVDDYILWQSVKLGRDIVTDKLTELILQAGAKRAVITEPSYAVVPNNAVASLGTKTVTFGGIEDE